MENKYKIDTVQLIIEFLTEEGIRNTFENSLYNYALYTCGGDFDMFDDSPMLHKFLPRLR